MWSLFVLWFIFYIINVCGLNLFIHNWWELELRILLNFCIFKQTIEKVKTDKADKPYQDVKILNVSVPKPWSSILEIVSSTWLLIMLGTLYLGSSCFQVNIHTETIYICVCDCVHVLSLSSEMNELLCKIPWFQF